MRVIAYVRVSTEKQVVEGLGMDVQRQAIRSWASEKEHRLVTVRSVNKSGWAG